ncbi:hypothetical protein JCM3766R1_006580 [Sporobolomyces carnicolor]
MPPTDATPPTRSTKPVLPPPTTTRHDVTVNPFSPLNFTSSQPAPPPHAPTRASNLRHSITIAPPTTTTPPRAQHDHLEVSSTTPTGRSNPKSTTTPRRVGPGGVAFLPRYSPVDDECAFCGGTRERNKDHRREDMVSCYECGSSGHPTCLEWDDARLVKKVQGYAWLCQECKRCEVCDEKGDDNDIMFCDSCDRGWHRQHLTPPLAQIPRGKWTCPTCVKEANFFDAPLELELGQKRVRKQAQPIGLLSSSSSAALSGSGGGEEDSHQAKRGRPRKSAATTTTTPGRLDAFAVDGGDGTEDDDFDETSLLAKTTTRDRKGKARATGDDDNDHMNRYASAQYHHHPHLVLGGGGEQHHPIVKVPNDATFHHHQNQHGFGGAPAASSSSSAARSRSIYNSSFPVATTTTPKATARAMKRQRSSNARDGAGGGSSTPFADRPWLMPRPPPSPTTTTMVEDDSAARGASTSTAAAAGDSEDPYGGLLTREESRTDGRVPQDRDRKRFKAAREWVDRRELAKLKRLEKDEMDRKRDERRKATERNNNAAAAAAAAGGGGGSEAGLAAATGDFEPSVVGSAGASPSDVGVVVGTPGGGTEQRELRTHRPAFSTLLDHSQTPSSSGHWGTTISGYGGVGSNNSGGFMTPTGGGGGGNTMSSSSLLDAALAADESLLLPVLPANYTGLPIRPITSLVFPPYEIKTWYQAPFPEEYTRTAEGKLWVCECCLKYFRGEFEWGRHRLKCSLRHPPGDEIYRDGLISVFEVDGRKNKIYCQNLCLLAKQFLDHKTLYYDVEPFLFYVMTLAEPTGAKFVGYFSKEKRSPTNNVSCIMTLPVRQRKGWGNLLIDFSYLLSKKEARAGTPERPLSDLGLLSYRNYWTLTLFQYFDSLGDDHGDLNFKAISKATSMTKDDIYFVLRERNFITDLSQQPERPSPASSVHAPLPPAVGPHATLATAVASDRALSAAPSPASIDVHGASPGTDVIEDSASPPAPRPPFDTAAVTTSEDLTGNVLNARSNVSAPAEPPNLPGPPPGSGRAGSGGGGGGGTPSQRPSSRGAQSSSRKQRLAGTGRSRHGTPRSTAPPAAGGGGSQGPDGQHHHDDHHHHHDQPRPTVPTRYKIHFDRDVVREYLDKNRKKDWVRLRPDRLKWTPFLVTRGFGLATEVGSTAIEGSTVDTPGGGTGRAVAVGAKADNADQDEDDDEAMLERQQGEVVSGSPELEGDGFVQPAQVDDDDELGDGEGAATFNEPDDEDDEDEDDDALAFLDNSSSSSDSDDGDGYSSSSSIRRRRLRRASASTRPSRSTRQSTSAAPHHRPEQQQEARSSSSRPVRAATTTTTRTRATSRTRTQPQQQQQQREGEGSPPLSSPKRATRGTVLA